MMMPWTLQRYILREMGKTFLLTAAVLTGALGLGGGVMQMVELKEATPWQLVQLMTLVLPVAGALTLPIAALFSAAATYGRLSADNEFVACRSGGINLHVLFLPALALGLIAAAATFFCMSFVIPRMVMNIADIVSNNPLTFIQQRLSRPQGFKMKNHRIYADRIETDERGTVLLGGVAFVENQGESWVRYGTAQNIQLSFARDDQRLKVAGRMYGLTLFDRKEDQFSQVGEQEISAPDVPIFLQHQIRFLTLGELVHYWRSPQTWPPVVAAAQHLRTSLMRSAAQRALLADWSDDQKIVLGAEPKFVLTGSGMNALPDDDSVEIAEAVIEQTIHGQTRRLRARRAVLEPQQADGTSQAQVRIEAYNVMGSDSAHVAEKARETLGPAPVPVSILEQAANRELTELLADQGQLSEAVKKRQAEARNWLEGTYRRVVATLHERTAYTFSVLVLVILGAALGTVFRGAHAATAFGISFVPSLLVIILIVTGKQMAQNPGTYGWGLGMIWSGIVAVCALDWWTLARWVRR